jgi:hypothetical protein
MPHPPSTVAVGGWKVEGILHTHGNMRFDIGNDGESVLLVTPPLEFDALYNEPKPAREEDYQAYESQWLLNRIIELTGYPKAVKTP